MNEPFEPVKERAPWLEQATIFLTIHGSTAYGMNTPASDIDMTGIFVPPMEVLANPFANVEQVGYQNEIHDLIVFDIRKFLKLAYKGSVNAIEMLWMGERFWQRSGDVWEMLVERRNLFLSKKVFYSYLGHCKSELSAFKKGMEVGVLPNSSRSALYDKYGFDTKSASHITRLVRTCEEIARTGNIEVFRKDADELVAIRMGLKEASTIIDETERTMIRASSAIEFSKLPEVADEAKVKKLCFEVMNYCLKD